LHTLHLQGFADFYDRYKPVITDDQVDAIRVYRKLLQFIERWAGSSLPGAIGVGIKCVCIRIKMLGWTEVKIQEAFDSLVVMMGVVMW